MYLLWYIYMCTYIHIYLYWATHMCTCMYMYTYSHTTPTHSNTNCFLKCINIFSYEQWQIFSITHILANIWFHDIKGQMAFISIDNQNRKKYRRKVKGILLFSLFIYSYVHTLGHFSPRPPPPPSPPHALTSKQNLFYPFLQFCWREDTSNNKKDKAFLLVEIRIAIQRDS
jgi:hypothetical protein